MELTAVKGEDPQLEAILEAWLLRPTERQVMCPALYQATLSGSIDCVSQLLGLTDVEITHIDSIRIHHDVRVVVSEDTPDSIGLSKQCRGKFHADSSCTLQEVTAEKNTALHIAAEEGHAELAEQLVRWDTALLTSDNSRHETPLHLAARAGHCSVISRIVLLAQQSPNGAHDILMKRSISGDTVLHEAVRNGHENAVQLLMTEACALSTEVNYASISPLYLAVVRRSVGVVKALLEYEHTSAAGPNKQNALHAAVLGSQGITSMLLGWNAELAYKRDASGSTPLLYAASDGDATIVKEILNAAPLAVYIGDEEGLSPLHVAARMCHYSIINLMIDHCPDSFELRDNQGRNFLHIVAQHDSGIWRINYLGLIFRLIVLQLVPGLKKSAKPGGRISLHRQGLKKLVNQRDNQGNTPLHYASMNGSSAMISELIHHNNADTTVINNEGKTALDYTISLDCVFHMV